MARLMETIRTTDVPEGSVAITYLAQAGFAFKTPAGKVLFVDPYLSDCCNRLVGFKRMIPTLVEVDEASPDVLVSTHSHPDHLDIDAVAALAKRKGTLFVGAPDCGATYDELGIEADRRTILAEGEEAEVAGVRFRAVFADHGELAPEAVGLVMEIGGVRVYLVGDSAYRPQEILASLKGPVDVMISPINGQFGNMNGRETCLLGEQVGPRLLVACHFWMFVEHNGNPAEFLEHAKKLPKSIEPLVMAPGEARVVRRAT